MYTNITIDIGTCVYDCPDGYFINSVLSTCDNCASGCESCTNAAVGSCLTCFENFFLHDGACLEVCIPPKASDIFFWKCLVSCSPGLYLQGSTNMCRTCNPICTTCTSATICTSCKKGYILQIEECKEKCDEHYYPDRSDNLCKLCHAECLDCKGPLNSDCLNCSAGRYFSVGICRTDCPSGTFKNDTANNCDYCNTECSTCIGAETYECLTCPQGMNLNLTIDNSTCVSKCPLTSYELNGKCKPCPSNCLTCTSNAVDKCGSCDSGFFLELKSALGGTC